MYYNSFACDIKKMNILTKIVFIGLLIGWPAIACCQNAGTFPIIKLTADNSGKKLIIVKGQIFILTLPNHIDGGYRFDKPKYNAVILRLFKHSETSPGNNGKPGQPGHDAWQFIAVGKGASNLKITASRPWAGGGTIILFSNIIRVK